MGKKESDHKYYLKNKEKWKKYRANWINSGKCSEYFKRPEVKLKHKIWRENNPEYFREYNLIGGGMARKRVLRAVRKGILPNLKEVEIKCIHCEKRAEVYDHRDYNNPLEVNPVCRSCNRKLEPAKRRIYEITRAREQSDLSGRLLSSSCGVA